MNKEVWRNRCPDLGSLTRSETELAAMQQEMSKVLQGGDCHELIARLMRVEVKDILLLQVNINTEPKWLLVLAQGIKQHRLSQVC
jgi:hypothetical protein